MTRQRITLQAAAFLDSPQAARLGEAKVHAQEVATLFLECCYDGVGKAPHKLDGDDVHEILCHLLPEQLGKKDPRAPHVAPILRAFFAFLEGEQVVAQRYEIGQQLERDAAEFERIVRTGEGHVHGAPPKGTPFQHVAEKTGRNDPCPCGSGKKFKKCCGKGG
jgi:hypothetical protein